VKKQSNKFIFIAMKKDPTQSMLTILTLFSLPTRLPRLLSLSLRQRNIKDA